MAPAEGGRPNSKNVPAATDYTSGAADRVSSLSSRDALRPRKRRASAGMGEAREAQEQASTLLQGFNAWHLLP